MKEKSRQKQTFENFGTLANGKYTLGYKNIGYII